MTTEVWKTNLATTVGTKAPNPNHLNPRSTKPKNSSLRRITNTSITSASHGRRVVGRILSDAQGDGGGRRRHAHGDEQGHHAPQPGDRRPEPADRHAHPRPGGRRQPRQPAPR